MNLSNIDIESIDNIYGKLIVGKAILKHEFSKIVDMVNDYEPLLGIENRKASGSFYTPGFIIKYMVKKVLEKVDIAANPFLKILDPSCGCGFFLLEVYDQLLDVYTNKLDVINEMHPDIKLEMDKIHEHIIKNNIFGADTDQYGTKLTIISLMLKKPGELQIPNIKCCDSIIKMKDELAENCILWDMKFDIVIGNPPYIGHKKMENTYRKALSNIYGDIFKDKADISYCFIKSSLERLNHGGKLYFITSRYFIESPSGRALRSYIKQECTINNIIDFYGVRIIKGVSVDPVIIDISKRLPENENILCVSKAKLELKNLDGDQIFAKLEKKNTGYYDIFTVNQSELSDEGWSLCNSDTASIIKKIESQVNSKLSDVCFSFQGIITGCDRAFIVNLETIKEYNIEKELLKKWIKNSNVNKYTTNANSKFIIYSNLINEVDHYKGALSYIGQYKDKLMTRRECKNGTRKWYELQWGRDSRLFENRKIIFPYKSSKNKFAIDQGNYSSADIYGLIIKDEYQDDVSYEYLSGILNSKLYEFYFKSFAKKLGDDLYDYYPNTVMRIKIPSKEDITIYRLVKEILLMSDEKKIGLIMTQIDNYIYKMFGLTQSEIELIEGRIR